MNNEAKILLGIGTIILLMLCLAGLNFYQTGQIQNDTNTLKNYDIGIAKYVQANSQALTFLNGCMVTKDNNTTTELVCKKVNQQ